MRVSDESLNKQYGNRRVLGSPFYVAVKDSTKKTGFRSVLHVVAECRCGHVSVVRAAGLVRGLASRCKTCHFKDINTTHGQSRTPLYKVWASMRRRSYNRNGKCSSYATIDIDPRWDASNGFEAFYADMGDPPSGKHSIDRIDNTQGYWPWNCRWATIEQQHRNKSNNVHLTFNGVTKCLADWADSNNIASTTLHYRINRGWSVEEALTKVPCGK